MHDLPRSLVERSELVSCHRWVAVGCHKYPSVCKRSVIEGCHAVSTCTAAGGKDCCGMMGVAAGGKPNGFDVATAAAAGAVPMISGAAVGVDMRGVFCTGVGEFELK